MSDFTYSKNVPVGGEVSVGTQSTEQSRAPRKGSMTGSLMMLCCVGMFAVFAAVVFFAPVDQSWTQTALSAAPLLGCVGAHLIMHRFMGRSCHGEKRQK